MKKIFILVTMSCCGDSQSFGVVSIHNDIESARNALVTHFNAGRRAFISDYGEENVYTEMGTLHANVEKSDDTLHYNVKYLIESERVED